MVTADGPGRGIILIFCFTHSLIKIAPGSDIANLELFENEPKGELTIIISEKQINKNTSQKISESDKNSIKIMLHKLSTKEITNIISQYSNVSKKEIYEYCVKLKNEK